jgi:hypothetical protein
MTVRELIEKLEAWPQDAQVSVAVPSTGTLADVRRIASVDYWAAYNEGFVVID